MDSQGEMALSQLTSAITEINQRSFQLASPEILFRPVLGRFDSGPCVSWRRAGLLSLSLYVPTGKTNLMHTNDRRIFFGRQNNVLLSAEEPSAIYRSFQEPSAIEIRTLYGLPTNFTRSESACNLQKNLVHVHTETKQNVLEKK